MNVTPSRVRNVDIEVTAPPSKSYTHRALIIGALGKGTTTVLHPLYAEDTKITVNALRTLGVAITEKPDRIIVTGCDGTFPNPENTTLDLDNSGTSLRLLDFACPALQASGYPHRKCKNAGTPDRTSRAGSLLSRGFW